MDRKWLGLLLIIIGGIFSLSNLGYYPGEFTLMIVGILLVVTYYRSGDSVYRRKQGLLITGAIVTMVGLFAVIEQNLPVGNRDGYLFFVFLGIAFLAVFLIHTRHLKTLPLGKRRWPLYPAAALGGFALFVFVVEFMDQDLIEPVLNNAFPVGLIVVGVILIVKAFRKGK
ncbi:hypothetical protein [Isachenkonia alkalipeptolytica]|uniref:DUF5668 domain-containing protein n=1 Tax=Isachenkonia alkalipeptolytica TaxID=2565777 RepID=A0AA43XI67_9CLOT|nr:hypothetical protein [Isachenkonia alkalipeptolytica]NBG86926.1 hypothetical protein [Isachenkonia alkalipeptolytica]